MLVGAPVTLLGDGVSQSACPARRGGRSASPEKLEEFADQRDHGTFKWVKRACAITATWPDELRSRPAESNDAAAI
jgi:hypothetical protein